MLGALRNAFKIEDLRRKMLFTLAMLLVYRIGSFIPAPGIDARGLAARMGEGSVFGLLDLFTGGALSRFTIFALGVNPYITASIVLQLLTVVIPHLEELAKEGIEGRKKMAQYTRWGTLVLGVIQAYGTLLYVREFVINPGLASTLLIITTLTAGTMFLMWLGEKISEEGIGNGISLLIFFGIVARLPATAYSIAQALGEGGVSIFAVLIFIAVAVLLIAGVVVIQQAQRRIPVQYAKRVVGRRLYGGQSTHIPLRINHAGVIPVIFASSVLAFPLTLFQLVPALSKYSNYLRYGSFWYALVYVLLIVFFTYFYTAITFNSVQVADNMKKYGGFIPGLRPGRATAEYLERVLSRLTLVGALFLAGIAVAPFLITGIFKFQGFYFGGTSLLIMVGVALDTMMQIEAQLLMRRYEGFIS